MKSIEKHYRMYCKQVASIPEMQYDSELGSTLRPSPCPAGIPHDAGLCPLEHLTARAANGAETYLVCTLASRAHKISQETDSI